MSEVAFREAASDEVGPAVLAQILELSHACWPEGQFTPDDLDHALGGRHYLAEVDGRVIGHAAVVPRVLEVGGRVLRAGYVEAVATLPRFQRRGIASRLMTAADTHIADAYELGALSTGEPSFYERFGWLRWAGPTSVREPDGSLTRTPDEDDGVMVLLTPTSPAIDLASPITCRRRPGDAW